MNHNFSDVLSRIPEPPKWFDENAYPRFCDFEPSWCSNIYADECALVRIQCQACARDFDVCFSESTMTRIRTNLIAQREGLGPTLADQIRDGSIHYGDPPNIDCCPAGPTMNSNPKRVLQYWSLLHVTHTWARDASLEVDIKADWAEETVGP